MPEHHATGGPSLLDVAVVVLALAAVAGYLWAVAVGRGRRWPRWRVLLWVAGTGTAALAVTGPLAEAAHHSFRAHMVTHLLLGMLAPLLLVLSAPVTALLRALPVPAARAVTRALRTPLLRVLTDPVVAALLNVGGLWVLYTTSLYAAVHTNPVVHVGVHLHVLLAGYLFTAATVRADPLPYRSHAYRAAVLVGALAAHDVLAKHLYAHPPVGVTAAQAESGSVLMYYGGDAVDLALIVLLCASWYRATRPRERVAAPA
ncbi:cytochrome c oxidase assembly protein [Auraticoccus monumenti]|uniref:Putative membrane protein n=1 Tax=Auraticoccus monumenti TaxID=675864 RepID=A0A1G6WEV6_9ACTN|nr:cytochrome c oxidase assembly protein [Auraticoccus monumenti]SDD64329.1 putative membrane protein [Auraticoccus monumenti]